MNLSLLTPPFESLCSIASTDIDAFTGTHSTDPGTSEVSETDPGSRDSGESEGMAIRAVPSSFDCAGGNSEVDVCFSPLSASMFTGTGTG